MIFFTSDTHFSHARINDLAARPFRDVQHMNEMIVKGWNETIAPNDIVYHLGDVAMGSFVDSIQYVNRLAGTKLLVPGNHDRVSSVESLARQERFLPAYEGVFDMVLSELETVRLVPDGPLISLSHYPYDGDSHIEDRFASLRPPDNGRVLLHGHTHSKEKISRSKKGTLQIHVGVDAWNFFPVSQHSIIKLIKENS